MDELAKQRGLTRSDCILIEKFLDLKPASRQAVMEYMKRVVSALSDDESAAALPAAPVFAPAPPDTGGQERSAPDLAAKVADLERQNDELAAKVAVMEEENALSGLTGVTSPSPSVSVGNFSPAQKAKK